MGARYRGGACLGSCLGDRRRRFVWGARRGFKQASLLHLLTTGIGTNRRQPLMHPRVEARGGARTRRCLPARRQLLGSVQSVRRCGKRRYTDRCLHGALARRRIARTEGCRGMGRTRGRPARHPPRSRQWTIGTRSDRYRGAREVFPLSDGAGDHIRASRLPPSR
jgi:hypothetical protein